VKPGDHLSSPRTGYTHHGIYFGDNQVIHYSGFANGFSKGAIGRTHIDEFSCGNSIDVVPHLFKPFSPEEVVRRAEGRLGEDWYNFLVNNCEHFATWCVTGFHTSPQVNRMTASIMLTPKIARLLAQREFEALEMTAPKVIPLLRQGAGMKAASNLVGAASAMTGLSTTTGVAAGVASGAGLMSLGAAGPMLVGLTSATAAGALLPVAGAVAVGFGVKKLIDFCTDY
jgi:hypothetical protein